MDDKKKTFFIPEAEIVCLMKEDIITDSAGTRGWSEDDNVEDWGKHYNA